MSLVVWESKRGSSHLLMYPRSWWSCSTSLAVEVSLFHFALATFQGSGAEPYMIERGIPISHRSLSSANSLHRTRDSPAAKEAKESSHGSQLERKGKLERRQGQAE